MVRFLLVMVLCMPTLTRADEPSFQGKAPAEWLEALKTHRAETYEALSAPEAQPVLLALLRHEQVTVREDAIRILYMSGARGPDVLAAALESRRDAHSSAVRNLSLSLLGLQGAPALEPLLEHLTDRSDMSRACAAHALASLGTAAAPAVDRLLALLADSSDVVRSEAVKALQATGASAERAGPALLRLYREDASPTVRHDTASALGAIGARASIPALREGLKDGERKVRLASAAALARLGEPEALRPLLAGIRDEFPHHRDDALDHIGLVGTSAEAAAALLEVLEHTDPCARIKAVRALAMVVEPDDARALAALERVAGGDAEPDVRKQASLMLKWLQSRREAASRPVGGAR